MKLYLLVSPLGGNASVRQARRVAKGVLFTHSRIQSLSTTDILQKAKR